MRQIRSVSTPIGSVASEEAPASRPICAEAFRWFERGSSAAGSPGLLSEELDVTQRQLRGNLPQAFVHAALLEAAAALAD